MRRQPFRRTRLARTSPRHQRQSNWHNRVLPCVRALRSPLYVNGGVMLVVSCTKCDGWVAALADENDQSLLAISIKEEAAKPDRKMTITKDVLDEKSFGLSGACRASYGTKPECS